MKSFTLEDIQNEQKQKELDQQNMKPRPSPTVMLEMNQEQWMEFLRSFKKNEKYEQTTA